MGANKIGGGNCERGIAGGTEERNSYRDDRHLIIIEFKFLRSNGGLLILALVIRLMGMMDASILLLWIFHYYGC